MKKNEIITFAVKHMDPETLILNKIAQTQKDSTVCLLFFLVPTFRCKYAIWSHHRNQENKNELWGEGRGRRHSREGYSRAQVARK